MTYYEAEATKIDYERRVVAIADESEIKGDTSHTEVPFDMLVVGVGAENATFGMCCSWPLQFFFFMLTLFSRNSRCQGAFVFLEGSWGCAENSYPDHGLC